jgi:cell division protein FtsW (lipid II flippase)
MVTSVVMFWLSGLPWEYFGTLYLWAFLCFLVMTNYFKIVAAVAPSGSQARAYTRPLFSSTLAVLSLTD